MISNFGKVYLLGRGGDPRSFRSARFSCYNVLSGTLGRLIFKSRFRSILLYTFAVVGLPAATALNMFRQSTAPTGLLEANMRELPACVSAFTLRASIAMAALALKWGFRVTYVSTDTRKPQSSVGVSTFDTPGPPTTDAMKWGGSAFFGTVLVAVA